MADKKEQEIISISKQAQELANNISEQIRQNKAETKESYFPKGTFVSEEVADKFLAAWKVWKNSDTGKFGYVVDKHKVELSQATFELLQELRKSRGEMDDGK